LSNPKKL